MQPEYQRRRGAGGTPSVSHVTHARHQESCLHTTRTSFSLPIPLSSTPGFCTAIGETLTIAGAEGSPGYNAVLWYSIMDPGSYHTPRSFHIQPLTLNTSSDLQPVSWVHGPLNS